MPGTSENASIRSGAIRRSLERLEKLVADVVARVVTLEGLTSRGAWTDVTFLNSWVNYDGVGGRDVEYRKVGDVVYLRGVMKTGAIGTVAFTLPSGFRPPFNGDYAVSSNNLFGVVTVAANGNVTPIVGNTAFVFLNGISFSTSS